MTSLWTECVGLTLECGEAVLKAMELLDSGNTSAYGHPVPTKVPLRQKKAVCVLLTLLHLGIKGIRLGLHSRLSSRPTCSTHWSKLLTYSRSQHRMMT